ncbi:MAG: molybdate transport system substrate-binding protein [Myxococcota bacterium]|jgi:molybdate transport system substrate-binding protein
MRYMLLALLSVSLLGACSPRQSGDPSTLTIFAASSLTEGFAALVTEFEAANPDIDVVLVLSGSQVLRLQLEQGAHADLFVSADRDHISALQAEGLVGDSRIIAYNALTIITPRDNPAGIRSVDDLQKARRLVVGNDNVPIGRYTQRWLEQRSPDFARRVGARVVSRESNVRLVRAKVALGEADAAVVYHSDALRLDTIREVRIPDADNVRASYHLGLLGDSEAARRFVKHVLSDAGQRTLQQTGFLPVRP